MMIETEKYDDLTDKMYANAGMHDENGAWQMIFGVNTLPAYRRHGYAEELIQCAIDDTRHQERKGLVLTCFSLSSRILYLRLPCLCASFWRIRIKTRNYFVSIPQMGSMFYT